MRMRLFALTAATLSLSAITGCAGDDGPGARGLGDNPINSVQSALASPTGEVDETSVPEVLSQSSAQDIINQFSGYASIPGLEALGDLEGFVSAALEEELDDLGDADDLDDLDDADDLGDSDLGDTDLGDTDDLDPTECATGTGLSGTIDISCASGGAASGSIEYQVQQSGTDVSVELTYANVCEGDICASGTLLIDAAVSEAGSLVTIAADCELTEGDERYDAQWGAQIAAGADGASVDWVVFDASGESFVLSATATDAGGSVSITGENGTFTCDYSEAASEGSCSGTGEFSW